jgi:hypothetical protein
MGDARGRRRAATIHAYVGGNGGGKSLALVHDTLPSLAMRWACDVPWHRHTIEGRTEGMRTVLSTVAIVDPATGDPHPQYVKLHRWRQLLEAEHTDVLLDEVQGVVSSRSHQSLPPAVLNLLLQQRRLDNVVRWSTPDYARADVVLRQVTQAVTYCRGYLPEPQRDPDNVRLWGSNRMFLWRTYDAFAFDEFTTSKREDLPRAIRQVFWRPSHDTQRWYDTYDQVSTIEDVTEAGTCLTCGGHRRRPSCSCEPAEDARTARTRAARRTDRSPAVSLPRQGSAA